MWRGRDRRAARGRLGLSPTNMFSVGPVEPGKEPKQPEDMARGKDDRGLLRPVGEQYGDSDWLCLEDEGRGSS